MHTPKAPTPPDPLKTAQAQTDMNVTGGVTTQLLNMVNQNTPDGSLRYDQTGNQTYTDANGKVFTIPKFTATQTLSPTQQRLYDLNNQTQQNIGRIGVEQSAKIGQLLNSPLDLGGPLDLSNTAIDDALYQRYSPRVTAQQKHDNSALDAQLAAQGITAGSEAWRDQINQRDQKNTDQWNQLYLTGRQQAVQEMLSGRQQDIQQKITARQEPINEITALLSGSQVNNPTFGNTPSSNIAPPNYEQDVANNYAQQMQAYQAKLASQNAMIGGIAGTIGAIGGGWARSDRRLKEDIWPVGKLANGLTLYSYRFKGDPERILHQGVMADEVMEVFPDAVRVDEASGFYQVDYNKVLN